jgi:CNT family concentrative nucleoside transporter
MADTTNAAGRPASPTAGPAIAPEVQPTTLGDHEKHVQQQHQHQQPHVQQPQTPPAYHSDTDKNEKAGVVGEVDAESQQAAAAHAAPEKRFGNIWKVLAHALVLVIFTVWWIVLIILRPREYHWLVMFLVWVLVTTRLIMYYTSQRRHVRNFVIFAIFTGWWVASLVLHRNDKNWVIPFLLYLAILIRIVTLYVPSRYASQGLRIVWTNTVIKVVQLIPARLRTIVGAVGAIAVILVGSFVSEETADNNRANRAVSLFGLAVILFVFWATSKHRNHINWQTVIVGMLSQYIIGLFVLRTKVGLDIFKWIAQEASIFLGFAKDGVAFLLTRDIANQGMFFWGVIPAIIFFISVVQVLYHVGFLQWFVRKMATFVFWALGVSGAEAVVAAATPFIGQGESAMLVRPFVPHMTNAELHQVMTCGFATISGSVLAGYIILGLPAEVLVSSCIMSIPASLAISKLRYPEVEETLTAGRVVIPEDAEDKAENALHAFANGALLGIKIAGSIVTSILCILAFVGLINGLLTWWGHYLDITDPDLTLQTIVSYLFYPVAFLLGVPRNGDLLKVAKLIAEKIITNEYNAFSAIANDPEYQDLSPRSVLIAAYAVCGFGNIGSLGIQIGILSQLAPSRGGDVAKLAVSALITGVFSTLTSAAVAGLVVTGQVTNFATAPPSS